MVTDVSKESTASSSTLKTEVAGFSEMLVLFYPSTPDHIPQDSDLGDSCSSYFVVVRIDFKYNFSYHDNKRSEI